MSRVARAFAAAIVVMTLAGGVAAAAPRFEERSTVEDRNDTRGRLDLAKAVFTKEAGLPPVWRITTFAEWRTRQMWDAGFVWIELDTRYGEDSDYYVLLRADRDRMRGVLFRVTLDPKKGDAKVADIRAWRPGRDQVAMALPLNRVSFGEGRTTYGWWVVSSFAGDVCPRTCFDRVPDGAGNAVSQDAPGYPPPA